jgi:hypothetical protein
MSKEVFNLISFLLLVSSWGSPEALLVCGLLSQPQERVAKMKSFI